MVPKRDEQMGMTRPQQTAYSSPKVKSVLTIR
jgi:hypothetical protein